MHGYSAKRFCALHGNCARDNPDNRRLLRIGDYGNDHGGKRKFRNMAGRSNEVTPM